MKLLKYIIPLWIGVFVYTVLSLCFGSQGFSAYSQLEAEKNREIMNITALEEINTDLAKIRDVLLKDRDNFHVHARELGFAAPGEHFVRIIGLGTPSKPQRFPGQVISPVKPDCIPDKGLIIFSFFAAFTIFVSMGTYDFLKFIKEKETGSPQFRFKNIYSN